MTPLEINTTEEPSTPPPHNPQSPETPKARVVNRSANIMTVQNTRANR